MRNSTLLAVAVLALPAFGARPDPAKWTFASEAASVAPGAKVLLKLTAKLDDGWHLYSLTTPPGGPNPTTIKLAESPALEGARVFEPKPERKFDQGFQIETETYLGEVPFLLEASLARSAPAGSLELTAQMRYQVCTDKECLPPVKKTAALALKVDPSAPAPPVAIPPGYIAAIAAAAAPAAPSPQAPKPAAASSQQDFGAFLLVAFLAGLAAIFTPCVFPMIPITMSFFLNRGEATRGQALRQALLFSVGIIVLFSGLGLATTAILGPFGIVQLGSNPWVNLFIAAVFAVFGLSLLGLFEITLPSGLLTRLDQASQRGGLLGTLLMGVTFSLTSFACVGPFIGPLLAASVQGSKLQPVFGMLLFSTGLSTPFFLLALFPSYLQRMPRSGGWLARVKIVLGFIVMAAMLKYLSNIDQVLQWNILTRERFLAAWVVLFALPGIYLLGFLPLEGMKPGEKLGVGRLLAGAAFLAFAVSLLPGMFGARLGELDAYVPLGGGGGGPAGTQPARLVWLENDYQGAVSRARREGKLVLVNFTGYACTNCHWMKANMFPRPEVIASLENLVLVELYTDGTDEPSRRNQDLQEKKFSTVAIPYYALIDGDEKVVATFPGVTRDPAEFVAFLRTGSPAQNTRL